MLALGPLLSCPAGAATERSEAEIAQARERFVIARKLEDAGRWAEALMQLKLVAAVKTTPQVRFHIALCMESLGQWTDALDGYAQAATDAKGIAPDVVVEANEHIHKLETATPTVSVHVVEPVEGDALFLDSRALPVDDHPLAIRADPGLHRAEVRRGATVIAREYFMLDPKTTRRLELRVGSVAPTPPGWKDEATSTDRGDKGTPAAGTPGSGETPRVLGYVSLGTAGLSVIAAGTFIGLRAGAQGRLDAACPALTRCDPAVDAIVREGKAYAALVNVFVVLGSAAAAGGVALLLTAPRPAPRPASAPAANVTFAPILGRGVAGLSIEGAF
jgi:hypothetical protein